MGKINSPEKVKLIIPVLYSSKEKYEKIKDELISLYGETDYISDVIDFTYTDYYDSEMGRPIYRVFLSFKDLINSEDLVDIKIKTNELELKYIEGDKRKVNLDPGYIDLAKFILASTKDYSHRIHLGKGIYAEITLAFKKKSFVKVEMTYRDYASKEYIEILNELRENYKLELSRSI